MTTKKNKSKPTKYGNLTRAEVEHQYKLELMKNCQIYGKSYESSKAYFESKSYTLGKTQYTSLRTELRSTKMAKEWFSKEALYVMEDDHMLSVERIRLLENRIMEEFEAVAATNFYKYINEGTEEQEVIRNKSHDANLMLRIVGQFQSLQETKTKMFSATPLVQEMMEVHRRQEEESTMPATIPDKTEKVIKHT